MKKYLILFSIITFTSPLFGEKIHPKAGTTSASFLKLGIGARAIGMGQSFVAVADDATAPAWNPAGSSALLYKQIVAMHHVHFQDISQDFIGYIHPMKNWAWGVTARGLFYPNDLERRSGLGEDIPEEPLTAFTDKFGGNDISVAANISKTLENKISLGANLRFIRQKIDVETGSTFSFDLGALGGFPKHWRKPWTQLTWGAAVQNIGPGIKFVDQTFDLPLNFKSGLAYRPFEDRLIVVFDYNQSIDNYPFLSTGVEWNFAKILSFRTGYRYKINGNDLGQLSGLSAGVGLTLFERSSVDYAFLPQGDLGNTHRISMSFKFGRQKKRKIPKKISLPRSVPIQTLRYKQTETVVKQKKIAFRKVYSTVTSIPPEDFPVRLISFNVESPAGKPFTVSLEVAEEYSISKKLKSLLPYDSYPYAVIAIRHNIQAMATANAAILFEVKNDWMAKNKLEPGDIYIINNDGTIIKASPVEEKEETMIFEAHLPHLSPYLIIIGYRGRS